MAKKTIEIAADVRKVFGKKVKRLRNEGLVPATMYGKGMESMSLTFDGRKLKKIFEEVGESGLISVKVEEKEYPVILRNPQWGPVSDDLEHIDCYKVDLTKTVEATVPINLVGESPAVKAGNVLVEVTLEVQVEALPTDLPEEIEVDISGLEEIEQMITVGDLKVDEKVEILTAKDQVVVKTEEPKEEEEPEEVIEPSEVPATAQKEAEEGTEEGEGKQGEKEEKEPQSEAEPESSK